VKLRDIQGLKFPDEYLIKFFFKEGLNNRTGDVVEFGCGNGNNLMLFNQFGWNTVGIDLDSDKINFAEQNFAKCSEDHNYLFIRSDISKGIKDILPAKFDVVLFPSVLYYISRKAVLKLLDEVTHYVKSTFLTYVRMRSVKDYRYGRGKQVEHNGFILDIKETGEYQHLNVFYHEYELVDMLREKLGLETSSLQIFTVDCLNLHEGIPVFNSDLVIWGKCSIGAQGPQG
jgi:SAM-dependent methyltransferase